MNERSGRRSNDDGATFRTWYLEWIRLCGDAIIETSEQGMSAFLAALRKNIERSEYDTNYLVHLANSYRYCNSVDALWEELTDGCDHTFWYSCLVYVQDVTEVTSLSKLFKGIGIGERWSIFDIIHDQDVENFWIMSVRIWRCVFEVFDGVRGRNREKARLREQFAAWTEEYIKIGRTLNSDLSEEERERYLREALASGFDYHMLK